MSRLCKLNYASYVNYIIPLIIYLNNLILYNPLLYKQLNKLHVFTCISANYCGIIKLTYKLGGNMKQKPKKSVKNQTLKKQNLLYHKAEKITDHLFQTNDFFDPHDLLQVKYEMLRRVQKDGWPVTKTASVFGFSRLSFYKILSAFESSGMTGLLPKKKGPKKPNKITDAVLSFIRDTQNKEPETKARKLKILIKTKFGIDLHKRTIERIYKKKPSTG